MAARLVIGLFESKGVGENARNRLKTEGVPASEIGLKMLSAIGPIPSTMEPELDAAFLSPVILGNSAIRLRHISAMERRWFVSRRLPTSRWNWPSTR